MDVTATAAVFALAATATHWTTTNLGPRTTITHAGYTWTVELPATGQGNARIVGRDGYGGTELLNIEATPGQTIGIVEAAVSALRAPTADAADPRWDVEDDGLTIGTHPTEPAAKAHVQTLLLAGRPNPEQVTVYWDCPLCHDSDECPDCEAGRTTPLMAYLQREGCISYATSYTIRLAA